MWTGKSGEYAETAFTEFKSADTLCEALKTEGFTVERPVAGVDTAFCGSWGQGSPVIAFLGEYDALSDSARKQESRKRTLLYPGKTDMDAAIIISAQERWRQRSLSGST